MIEKHADGSMSFMGIPVVICDELDAVGVVLAALEAAPTPLSAALHIAGIDSERAIGRIAEARA